MTRFLEYGPLVVNGLVLVHYSLNYTPGKFLYWLGAFILNIGVVVMKG